MDRCAERIELSLTCQKVRAYLAANPDSGKTLESLLAAEKAKFPNVKDRKASEGLMWLLRGLKFTARGLRHNVNNPTEELSASFTKGYEESLRKWHGMMVRPLFSVSHRSHLRLLVLYRLVRKLLLTPSSP